MPDYIVKDSSLWQHKKVSGALKHRDTQVRIGIVKEGRFNEKEGKGQRRYVVEVYDNGNRVPVLCVPTSRFGGAYNYEEYVLQGFTQGQSEEGLGSYNIRPGDVVVIAYLGGLSKEGVILGYVQQHSARTPNIQDEQDVSYYSEFNGLKTTINKDGEYKITFRGAPTNQSALNNPVTGTPIPDPVYPEETTGSYYEFDKQGSWHVNDAAQEKPQLIKIHKAEGTITIQSGNIILKMEKEPEFTTLTTKQLTINATDKITSTTKESSLTAQNKIIQATKQYKFTASEKVEGTTDKYSLDATSEYKVKSNKVSIGKPGVEVVDILSQTLDFLSKTTAAGFGAPISTVSDFAALKSLIDQIKL